MQDVTRLVGPTVGSYNNDQMKTSINLRFLLVSVVGFVVLGAAASVLHAFQFHRQSAFMLDRARQFKTEKRFERALRSYQLYLQMVPGDVDARAEFGLMLADCGLAKMAAIQLEAVLRIVPERLDLRRRLVDLDIALQRYNDAREHLRFLLAVQGDGKPWQQLGICQDANGDYAGAVRVVAEGDRALPGLCESYVRLAEVLRLRLRPRQRGRQLGWTNSSEKTPIPRGPIRCGHAIYIRELRTRKRSCAGEKAASGEAGSGQEKPALREAEKAAELDPRIPTPSCWPQTSRP